MAYRYITAEDVRNYILDRSQADNSLTMDLHFSDREVADAMMRCARDYNSIPPLIGWVDPEKLPGDTNIFLDGTAKQLCISELSKLCRQDFDYTAGGVTTNIAAKRIEHLKMLIKLFGDQFVTAAAAAKMAINLRSAYGKVG